MADEDSVTPESTVTFRTSDLLNRMEGRISGYIGDVEGRLTSAIGELRGGIGSLATKADVARLDATDSALAQQVASNRSLIEAHAHAIGEIDAVGRHKRSNWATAAWCVATALIAITAVTGLLVALR